jgi:hypothetical protein
MMHISTFLELEQEDMGEVNNNPAVCSMGQTGGYQQAGPQGESRRERRVQRDTSYSQQLPSPNRGMHMNQNPGNTGLQQIVPSPNKGNRVMLGPPPNPGPYGPRLIANPVTPGRASNPVGAIGINWGNQASPQAQPWSSTATATPPTRLKPDPSSLSYGFCDGCGSSHVGFRTPEYAGGCTFKNKRHPDFNHEGSWATSYIGRQYLNIGQPHLLMHKQLRSGSC